MTLLKGFGITLATGLLFAMVGAVIGFLLAKYVPEYYFLMFGIPEEHAYRLTPFGLVLGGLQGLARDSSVDWSSPGWSPGTRSVCRR